MEDRWTKNLFGCFKNPTMCVCATCIPGGCCFMHSMNANVSRDVEGSNQNACIALCCVITLLPIGACFNRFRIRQKYDIKSTSRCASECCRCKDCCCGMCSDIGCDTCECCSYCSFWDCIVSFICPCCAVVQEWREVMSREKGDSAIKFWETSYK